MGTGETMRDSIAESILGTIQDLNRSGLVGNPTLEFFEELCFPETLDLPPEKTSRIRKFPD